MGIVAVQREMKAADLVTDGMVRCADCQHSKRKRKYSKNSDGSTKKHSRWECTGIEKGFSLARERWRRCEGFKVRRGITGYA